MGFASFTLSARDGDGFLDDESPLTFDLLIALLVLLVVCAVAGTTLLLLRRRRLAAQQSQLPMYNNGSLTTSGSKHRRTPSSRNIPSSYHSTSNQHHFDYSEKRTLSTADSMPPKYPVPEIRIHFSEEPDATGDKPQPQRVVVVRMGDNGMGLEPVEEQLPSYQKDSSDRFHSIDIERLGGLKEKDQTSH